MGTIDIVIIILVIWAAYNGWKQGLIKELVSLVGFFVGLIVAFQLYATFGDYLAPRLSSDGAVNGTVIRLLAFVLIWIIVPIVLGLVANILTKSLKLIRLGFINSFAGMLLSVAKYLILMSSVFCAMDFLNILDNQKKEEALLYQPVASIVKGFFADQPKPQPSEPEAETSDTIWIDVHKDEAKKAVE